MKNFKFTDHLFFLPFMIALLILLVVKGAAVKSSWLIEKENLRDFTMTAYCPGPCCNGPWAYKTATGKNMGYYIGKGIHIAATDPTVIPRGTRFVYQGKEYLAVDVGSAIKGRRIDLLFFSHAETERFGIKHHQDVKILR